MILYDWKKRLKKDSKDFIENKIPEGDYDFEIIYNAYPERDEGHVPAEVITYVAKQLGKIIAENTDKYVDFLRHVKKHKGREGNKIFNFILKKVTLKNPGEYDELLTEGLHLAKDSKSMRRMFDFIILPLLKKYPEKYVDKVLEWADPKNKPLLIKHVFRIMGRYIKAYPDQTKIIFEKCESHWNSDNKAIQDGNIRLLKQIFKIDKEFYNSIYESYKSTRNPHFVQILSGAIMEDNKIIREMVKNWKKSGNSIIKKAGEKAKKHLKKIK